MHCIGGINSARIKDETRPRVMHVTNETVRDCTCIRYAPVAALPKRHVLLSRFYGDPSKISNHRSRNLAFGSVNQETAYAALCSDPKVRLSKRKPSRNIKLCEKRS